MGRDSVRRITLRDMMVLIAASAPGFALLGSTYVSSGLGWTSWRDAYLPGGRGLQAMGGPRLDMGHVVPWAEALLPFLAVETGAVLLLRCLRPRPSFRELACQPGLAACGAATLSAFAVLRIADLGVGLKPSIVGVSVGVAWVVLAASRRWHAEPSWVDRAGRVVGVAWLVTVPLFAWFQQHP